jgi:hypothetical protein
MIDELSTGIRMEMGNHNQVLRAVVDGNSGLTPVLDNEL